MKKCAKCREIKGESEFGQNRSYKDGLHCYCKDCAGEKLREWRKRNPEKARAIQKRYLESEYGKAKARERQHQWYLRNKEKVREYNRKWREEHSLRWRLEKKYGMSLSTYREILERQGGGCAICGVDKHLVVDHSHRTGKVRGILCSRHNRGLGAFQDRMDYLMTAADYLHRTE